ncbi:MAG: Glucose-1-phosphate thymidylyltransferase 1 [Chlamydiae bacterium]|nr:Glucose-1-phosphate thymidylyltransferase 1 [Chlamydiota bacterium]
MKGIVLAGGRGSRLYPLTFATCKQLLPLYDKPMIYYPLSVLVMAGISEILLICNREDEASFRSILKDGSQWGITISFAIQEEPRGIADAFIVGEEFIGEDSVALILGDNIFSGQNLGRLLLQARELHEGGHIFGYEVERPEQYGVLKLAGHEIIDIIEKPVSPPSHYAVTGLYFYDNEVIEIAKQLHPSARGEIEITDINRSYLKRGKLNCQLLDRGFAWLDTGSYDTLLAAAHYVQHMQKRQGIKIGCLEEEAFRRGFIDSNQLVALAKSHENSEYGQYLKAVATRIDHPELLTSSLG